MASAPIGAFLFILVLSAYCDVELEAQGSTLLVLVVGQASTSHYT